MTWRYRWLYFFLASILIACLWLPNFASAQEPIPSQGSQQTPQLESQPEPKQSKPAAEGQPQKGLNPAPDQKTADQNTTNQGAVSSIQQKSTVPTSPKNDRLFGVLPNYLTVENEAQVPPLTAGGKFKLVTKNSFDPAVFPFIGFIALVSQAQDSEPSFGQGVEGYAKRYGVAFANSTIGSYMTGAVFPSIFKQDPRYFQLVRGGFKSRVAYSVSRIFVIRTDSGRSQFNASEIVGNLVGAGISNAYLPAQDRSLSNTLTGWGTGTGYDALANLAEEFWPDVHRFLRQKF
jgi:hypothetical protein